MQINQNNKLEEVEVKMKGAEDVVMKILIGPRDNSGNIIMRHFKVMPGGHTPKHQHDFEHVVKIERGKGIMVDKNDNEHEVSVGYSAFVPANEMHQFKNPYNEPFEFLCIIPNPDKNSCCT